MCSSFILNESTHIKYDIQEAACVRKLIRSDKCQYGKIPFILNKLNAIHD